MTDVTGFNCFDHFVCYTKYSSVCKACHHFGSAVDSCELSVFRVTAEFQGFLDHRSEIFLIVNVDDFREGYHFCGKYTVFIACFRRHEAVGRVEDRGRNVVKFFLLVLPCSAEVSFKMQVFLQFRVCVCREHFAVCVNVDSFTFCLLKEKLQVIEVMSCYYDKWAFFYFERYRYRCRVAECFGVRFIKKCHAA